jgi:hypothetical protein
MKVGDLLIKSFGRNEYGKVVFVVCLVIRIGELEESKHLDGIVLHDSESRPEIRWRIGQIVSISSYGWRRIP